MPISTESCSDVTSVSNRDIDDIQISPHLNSFDFIVPPYFVGHAQ